MTAQRVFGYDTLVVSIGSLSNDFGTPGVAEHAMKLETAADAQRFRTGSSMPASAPMRRQRRCALSN